MSIMSRLALVASVVVLSASAVRAQAQDPNPFDRGTKDILSFSVGGFLMTFNTTAELDPKNGQGTTIDLEKDLDLADKANRVRFDGYWRIKPRHRLDFGWLLYDRETNHSLSKQIVWGDTTFDIGASLDTSTRNQLIKTAYRYSYVRNARVDASVSGGLSTIINKMSLSGSGSVNGQGASFTKEGKSVTAPVPMFGLGVEVKIAKPLYFRANEEYFHIKISNVDGRVNDFRASFDYYPWKHVGFGLGYNRFGVKVEDVAGSTYLFNYHFDGVLGYATYVF